MVAKPPAGSDAERLSKRGQVTLGAGLRRAIRTKLSSLLPDVHVARLVASDVGLPLHAISFQGTPETVWSGIIEEAERQACLPELLEVTRERCPGDDALPELTRQMLALTASSNPAPVAPPGPSGPKTSERPGNAPFTPAPVKLFYSYARADEKLRETLETHLAVLKRQNLIEAWRDRQIEAGQEWDETIKRQLAEAELVLLLVSPDFMASAYIWEKELAPALERLEQGKAVVVPIIVRPTDLKNIEFMKLQALPRDGKPVVTWASQDEAWVNVAKGLRQVVERIQGGIL